MTVSEMSVTTLKHEARRAYEGGRVRGALWRGAVAAGLAMPGFLFCNQTPWAAFCLAGFVLVVVAGRILGEGYEEGARSGAIAGILPCLLPAALRFVSPDLCALLLAHGLWICGAGGAAAGVILGLRSRGADGLPFWSSAVAALAFAAALGCIPAGAMGFTGLAVGMLAGAAPLVATRRASI